MIRRALLAPALCLALAQPALAAPDREAALSRDAPTTAWRGGPVTGLPVAEDVDPDDTLLVLADGGDLAIDLDGSSDVAPDIDVLLYAADAAGAPTGALLAEARTAGSNEDLAVPDLPPGRYVVRVVGFLAAEEGYDARAHLALRRSAVPPPAGPPDRDDHVACVVDSGINAAHEAFAPGQVVAWWDFTSPGGDDPTHFDVEHPVRDVNGHGTATAALVAGRPFAGVTPSMAPGASLAVARISDDAGRVVGDLGAAVRWCAETARADVISMSLGSLTTRLPHEPATYAALAAARERGVLVVVSNGNGVNNAFIPGPSGALGNFSASPAVLAVGASGTDGLRVSGDPEVAAQLTVRVPGPSTANGVRSVAGTSFGTPLVAGLALRALQASEGAGRRLTAAALEQLVKHAARDTEVPPSHEGYGVLDAARLPLVLEHARAGTSPPRPAPDVSAIYVEEVAARVRGAAAPPPG